MHRTASKVNVFVRAQGHLQLEVYRWACNTKVYEVYPTLANGRGENQKEAGSGKLGALSEKSRDEGRRRWSRLKFLPRQLQPLLLCSLRLKQRKHCTKSTCVILLYSFSQIYILFYVNSCKFTKGRTHLAAVPQEPCWDGR